MSQLDALISKFTQSQQEQAEQSKQADAHIQNCQAISNLTLSLWKVVDDLPSRWEDAKEPVRKRIVDVLLALGKEVKDQGLADRLKLLRQCTQVDAIRSHGDDGELRLELACLLLEESVKGNRPGVRKIVSQMFDGKLPRAITILASTSCGFWRAIVDGPQIVVMCEVQSAPPKGAELRDKWFAKMESEGLRPAEIRDKWNGLRPEERKSIDAKYGKPVGQDRSGMEVVVKALKRIKNQSA